MKTHCCWSRCVCSRASSAFGADLEVPIKRATCASAFHLDRMLCGRARPAADGGKKTSTIRRYPCSAHQLYVGTIFTFQRLHAWRPNRMRLSVRTQLGGRHRRLRHPAEISAATSASPLPAFQATAPRSMRKTDFLTSATGRVGYAWNDWLLYAKGGAAWAERQYSAFDVLATFDFEGLETQIRLDRWRRH